MFILHSKLFYMDGWILEEMINTVDGWTEKNIFSPAAQIVEH